MNNDDFEFLTSLLKLRRNYWQSVAEKETNEERRKEKIARAETYHDILQEIQKLESMIR